MSEATRSQEERKCPFVAFVLIPVRCIINFSYHTTSFKEAIAIPIFQMIKIENVMEWLPKGIFQAGGSGEHTGVSNCEASNSFLSSL